jgi:hypothetical protein
VGKLKVRAVYFLVVLLFIALVNAPDVVHIAGVWSPQMAGLAHSSSPGVIFLEHNLVANGTVVNGEAPFRSVNFPSYWYNENTRQIKGNIDFAVNDSLIMVFGDALTLKGDFGAGTGNKLFGVYGLPYKADQDIIYSTDLSGNVVIKINGNEMVLKPGDTYTYNTTGQLRNGKALTDVVYTHTYINHGFIDKNNIGTGPASPG